MATILLNRDNFYYNLNQLALKAGSREKLAVVLKDNAYGHGLEQMGKLAYSYGIQEAVVATNNEAIKIKEYFKNILVLGDTPIVDNRLSYAISSVSQLKYIEPNVKLELKVDTGMHRNGIMPSSLQEALNIIKRRKLNLYGVMTHFRSADELTGEYYWQKKEFEEIKRVVKEAGFSKTRFHSHNSAGLLRAKSFDEDIARVGIAIYGYNPLPKVFDFIELRPVLSLWAKRVSTRELKSGSRVGYGGDFIAPRDMLISTYNIGYGDGWFRGDSKNPYYIEDRFPILGRVSMDFLSLEGNRDEICMMQDAKRVSEHFKTIPYEVVTSLMPHIPRIII